MNTLTRNESENYIVKYLSLKTWLNETDDLQRVKNPVNSLIYLPAVNPSVQLKQKYSMLVSECEELVNTLDPKEQELINSICIEEGLQKSIDFSNFKDINLKLESVFKYYNDK